MKDYIYNKTKELLRFVVYILLPLTGGGWMGVSCSDMLEVESSRQLNDPSLNQKTDSVFYAYGILQAVQQLADQYYFQNEMRGDLVKPTDKASVHLQSLAAFRADASNKYDSVYRYYKVINNCNYYLAKRDTTLQTGGENVVINEYAAVAAFRAWTYLQLTRQYGNVPYMTEPVTTIEQINANTDMTDYTTILRGEIEMMEKLKARYSDAQLAAPTFGYSASYNGTTSSYQIKSIGELNWGGGTKYFRQDMCFVPFNVVLGDLYLELGQYDRAAKCYYDYLYYKKRTDPARTSINYYNSMSTDFSDYSPIFKNFTEWPADCNPGQNIYSETWQSTYKADALAGDVITYIPMAVNYTMGQTTDIPAAFGYNYYSTSRSSMVDIGVTFANFSCPRSEDIQVVPSQTYCDSARLARYYYYSDYVNTYPAHYSVRSGCYGDGRASLVAQGRGADSTYVYCHKPSTGYIYLYRTSTVWLHLAEALNRMGYPDAAFAILKNGIHQGMVEDSRYIVVYQKDDEGNYVLDDDQNKVIDPVNTHTSDQYYLKPATYELLTTTLPFLATENQEIFLSGNGIHEHGAGVVGNKWSPYKYDAVLKEKLADINAKFGLNLTTYTKQDTINAMEDLLCDEYAMEFAFEGTRFSDLRRLANHKNDAGLYGGDFGDVWLSRMLKNNAAGITTKNCYLPYK